MYHDPLAFDKYIVMYMKNVIIYIKVLIYKVLRLPLFSCVCTSIRALDKFYP